MLLIKVGRCSPVPVIAHSTANSSDSSDQSTVLLTADEGYVFKDGSTITTISCVERQWLASINETKKFQCLGLPQIDYMRSNSTGTDYASVVEMTCALGHAFSNNGVVTTITVQCSHTGWEIVLPSSWTCMPTQCYPLNCGPKPLVDFAISPVHTTNYYGSRLTYTSVNGYWFSRDHLTEIFSCDASGQWLPVATACVKIRCPALPTWNGLNSSNTDAGTAINAMCTYNSDNQKLVFSDNRNRVESVCDVRGRWVPTVSQCIVRNVTRFQPAPTEAEGSALIAVTVGVVLGTVLFTIVTADLVYLLPVILKKLR